MDTAPYESNLCQGKGMPRIFIPASSLAYKWVCAQSDCAHTYRLGSVCAKSGLHVFRVSLHVFGVSLHSVCILSLCPLTATYVR